METRALERTRDDADVSPILASLRCGESSILNAIHEELPEVFTAEILNRLDLRSTLNLAQVSKSYRDAVWSVDGMRSLGEKVKPFVFGKRAGLPHQLDGVGCNTRQLALDQGPSGVLLGARAKVLSTRSRGRAPSEGDHNRGRSTPGVCAWAHRGDRRTRL